MAYVEFEKIERGSVIHCPEKENAIILLNCLSSYGYKWCAGEALVDNDYWKLNESSTCYYLDYPRESEVSYGNYEIAKEEGETVIEFADLVLREYEEPERKSIDELMEFFGI